MAAVGTVGPILFFVASFGANALVLAYRWEKTPTVRRAVDRLRGRLLGRDEWSWLRLRHLMAPLGLVAVVNLAWSLSGTQCSSDALALLASGTATLHGQDPFQVAACGFPNPDPIPYGAAAIVLDAAGALSGSVAGVWLVWQLLALGVVPLVWAVGGDDRRYLSVLAATSVLYLPNLATRIDGPENAIVPIAALLGMYAVRVPGWRGRAVEGVSAFLSTARLPAVFPLLASSFPRARRSWSLPAIAVVVFAGAATACYALWGWTFVRVVYLNQFARGRPQSFNLFDLLFRQGLVHPSVALTAGQGVGLLVIVSLVTWRRYSPEVASGIVLVGVMLLTQYAMLHFDLWLVPLLLLGAAVNRALLLYGGLWYLDANVAMGYLGPSRGVWWPTELLGIALTGVLLYLLVRLARDGERRAHDAREVARPPA